MLVRIFIIFKLFLEEDTPRRVLPIPETPIGSNWPETGGKMGYETNEKVEYDDYVYDDRIRMYRNSVIEKHRESKRNSIVDSSRRNSQVKQHSRHPSDAIFVQQEFSDEASGEWPAKVEFVGDQNINVISWKQEFKLYVYIEL